MNSSPSLRHCHRLLAPAIFGTLTLGISFADDFPLALRSVELPEFHAARGWMESLPIDPGESHRIQFNAGAGTLISVATTSDGDFSLTLEDPGGSAALTQSVAGGSSLAVSLYPVGTAGLWSIGLENSGAGVVTVSCEVVVNAVLEEGANNTMAGARKLDGGLHSAAADTLLQAAAIGEVGTGPGSADWFRFSLDSPALVSVVVRPIGDETPEVVLVDAGGSPRENSEFTPLPAGDYFLEVTGDGARYGLGVVIGGWVWPLLETGLEGSVLGYMPPAPRPLQTSTYVADYGSGSSNQAAVANMIKTWSPEYIFTGGDNIYASGNVGVGAAGWKTLVGDFYGEFIQARADGAYPELTSPTQRFYPSVGNQDTTVVQPGGGSIAGYVDYFHDNPGGLPRLPIHGGAVHEAGESFYRVRRDMVELFMLDTDHARQNPASMDRQRNWVRAAVAGSDAPWRFVIAHHPPYSSPKSGGGFSELRWLETLDADVLFSGDSHTYERLDIGGPLALVVGIGGHSLARFRDALPQSRFHFDDAFGALRVDANITGVRISLLTIDDGANGNNGGRLIEEVDLGDPDLTDASPWGTDVEVRPLVAATLTPPLASGEPNHLDLKLRLLRDGENDVEAEDDNSAPDGRNARMLVPVDVDGAGYLEVTRQSDAGGPFEILFLDPYEAWLLDIDAPPGSDTSRGADIDYDGLSNWFEYSIASDPLQFSTVLTAAIDPDNPTNSHVNYPLRADRLERGILYSIEFTHDLVNWIPAPDGQQIGNPSAEVELWQITLPVNAGGTFVRMRAAGP